MSTARENLMDPAAFSTSVRALLAQDRFFDLGPGQPNQAVRPQLAALTTAELLSPHLVRQDDFARACLAGLWLYNDFLDESHAISQELASIEGSYWHAIMHRREPDYVNSKYWFRRVGQHSIFEALLHNAGTLIEAAGRPMGSTALVERHQWDPYAFVDVCEKALLQGGELDSLCRQIQRAEWDLLFAHCAAKAVQP